MKLIDKDALVAEIERRKNYNENEYKHSGDTYASVLMGEMEDILSFLDTLEMKEVGLDIQRFAKEMDAVFALPSSETKNTEEEPLNWEYSIAKHFYSLGLAQKGERV